MADPAFVDGGLRPYCWYREIVLRGAEYHAFPGWYIEKIRAVGHVRDHDDERRTRNGRTIEAMAGL